MDSNVDQELINDLLVDSMMKLSIDPGSVQRAKSPQTVTTFSSITLDAFDMPVSVPIDHQRLLHSLFERSFCIHSVLLARLAPQFRDLDYNTVTDPIVKLFLNTAFGIASVFLKHSQGVKEEKVFIGAARHLLLNVVCKSKVTIPLVAAIYTLSCYEFGHGDMLQSYLIDSIACSLTQHMGLHISYYEGHNDGDNGDKDGPTKTRYAPKQTPLSSSALWSICLHDRMVTSSLNVPCVIHFKRIIAPFYKVESDAGSPMHIRELAFAQISRLWYIYDRFSDQIFSVNFDIGDTNNRSKVLGTALKTLRELDASVPIQLRMQSLDWNLPSTDQTNLAILLFNFNYHMIHLLLNKIFFQDETSSTRLETVSAALKCGEIIMLLDHNTGEAHHVIDTDLLPYYLPNLIGTTCLVLMFMLSSGVGIKENATDKESVGKLYRACKSMMSKMSHTWRAVEKALEVITSKERKYDISLPEQEPSPVYIPNEEIWINDSSEQSSNAPSDQPTLPTDPPSWATEFPDLETLSGQHYRNLNTHNGPDYSIAGSNPPYQQFMEFSEQFWYPGPPLDPEGYSDS